MGAVAVPLNSLWKAAEYEYGLKDSGARVLVCDPERLEMAKTACERLGTHVIVGRGVAPPGTLQFDDVVRGGTKSQAAGSAIDPDDTAAIMCVKGSTAIRT